MKNVTLPKKKLSEIYEEFAHHYGWKDWNTMSASIPPGNRDEIKNLVRLVWRGNLNSEIELANTGEKNVRIKK